MNLLLVTLSIVIGLLNAIVLILAHANRRLKENLATSLKINEALLKLKDPNTNSQKDPILSLLGNLAETIERSSKVSDLPRPTTENTKGTINEFTVFTERGEFKYKFNEHIDENFSSYDIIFPNETEPILVACGRAYLETMFVEKSLSG